MQIGNAYQLIVKKQKLQLTREDLFQNAGPERKYEPRADFSEFYFFCIAVATPLLSFIGTGTVLMMITSFLAPSQAESNPLAQFCWYGCYGAWAGLVTHLMWACLTKAKMPLIPKLSISMFGSMSASLTVFADIAELAIKNVDLSAGLIVLSFCLVPGLTGGLLALCTKTRKFKFMITPYR